MRRRAGIRRLVGTRNFRVRHYGERVYSDSFRIECIVVSIRVVIVVVIVVVAVTVVVESWIYIGTRKSLSYIILVTNQVDVTSRCFLE